VQSAGRAHFNPPSRSIRRCSACPPASRAVLSPPRPPEFRATYGAMPSAKDKFAGRRHCDLAAEYPTLVASGVFRRGAPRPGRFSRSFRDEVRASRVDSARSYGRRAEVARDLITLRREIRPWVTLVDSA